VPGKKKEPMTEPDILRGYLAEHQLSHVLQAVSIGRQYVAVELSDARGARGTIYTKSGRVLAAEAEERSGLDALYALLDAPMETFRVYRMPTPSEVVQPLGLILDLIDPRRRSAVAQSTRPATSRPTSTVSSVGAPPPEAPASTSAPRPTSATLTPRASPPPSVAAPSAAVASSVAAPSTAVASSVTAPSPSAPRPAASITRPPAAAYATVHTPTPRAPTPTPIPTNYAVQAPTPPVSTPQSPAPHAPPAHTARTTTSTTTRAPLTSVPGRVAPVVAVASPKGGVGKTTVALNLALSLARQGHRTVLVDGDPNGDVMSMIDARDRPRGGAYDVLLGRAPLAECLLRTALDELSILPAIGQELPDADIFMNDLRPAWSSLFEALRRQADVIIVDTAAGHFGTTHFQLRAASHVLGVLQAESVAHRSFEVFGRALGALPEGERPQVLGVVLNMLQTAEGGSVEVLRRACSDLPPSWLFDVTIPRHPAFLHASSDGVPLGLVDERNPPAVAWLFDGLASEVAERLALHAPRERRPRRLLL
jgi:chromosome partitioning protein